MEIVALDRSSFRCLIRAVCGFEFGLPHDSNDSLEVIEDFETFALFCSDRINFKDSRMASY